MPGSKVTLRSTFLQIQAVKRDLKETSDRIIELERQFLALTPRTIAEIIGEPRPWEKLGVCERTYYNRRKAGKL